MTRREHYLAQRLRGVPADLAWSKVTGGPKPVRHLMREMESLHRLRRAAITFGQSLGLFGRELAKMAFDLTDGAIRTTEDE